MLDKLAHARLYCSYINRKDAQMKAIIKKHKGNWLVTLNNKNSLFTKHDEAIEYAYNEGATDFQIQYSNTVGRVFSREGIENFVLKVA